MIDMEMALAWKTSQGYADCSETLAEQLKEKQND